ncbi:MAG: hypothetical protein Q9206_005088 [Seirophora lacunosa]
MLAVGTYNAIITEPNEFYSPGTSDLAFSHKTFKRMMPAFAWELGTWFVPLDLFRQMGLGNQEVVGRLEMKDRGKEKQEGGREEDEGVAIAPEEGE